MPRFFDTKDGLRVDAAWAAFRQADQAVFCSHDGFGGCFADGGGNGTGSFTRRFHGDGHGGFKGREVAVDAETLTQPIARAFSRCPFGG